MLTRAYPELRWSGLYFGVWRFTRTLPPEARDMAGLVVDERRHAVTNPRTAICRYYHLIEDALEVEIPSVSSYRFAPGSDTVEPDSGRATPRAVAPGATDVHFGAVVDYVRDHAGDPPGAILNASELALERLAQRLWFPTRAELPSLLVRDRSIDFGATGSNPILRGLRGGAGRSSGFWWRFSRSLWKEGQLALEVSARPARLLQRLLFERRRLKAWALRVVGARA
jgi:hypothetical protein